MNLLKGVKTIFFDYDGTLHDSLYIYAPAFRKAYDYLVEKGLADSREWSKEEISYWLGFNPHDMWKNFMPNISDEVRQICSNIISKSMEQQLEQGDAFLYEGSLETLEYLKGKGYNLIFISNCKKYYKESHNKLFKLDRYFASLVSSEEYDYIPKYEILKKIKINYPGEMVIIGDRIQDIESGKKNGIYTIGCSYGYGLSGEIDNADYKIKDINELKKYL